MGAGALAKVIVHGDAEGGSVITGRSAGLRLKRKHYEGNPKDLYYGAAKKIQKKPLVGPGVVRND